MHVHVHVQACKGAVPAAGHAGTEGQASDLTQAPLQQLCTLSMLLSEQLQEAAHQGCMHVCLCLLLPRLPLLLHILCSARQATVKSSHTHHNVQWVIDTQMLVARGKSDIIRPACSGKGTVVTK